MVRLKRVYHKQLELLTDHLLRLLPGTTQYKCQIPLHNHDRVIVRVAQARQASFEAATGGWKQRRQMRNRKCKKYKKRRRSWTQNMVGVNQRANNRTIQLAMTLAVGSALRVMTRMLHHLPRPTRLRCTMVLILIPSISLLLLCFAAARDPSLSPRSSSSSSWREYSSSCRCHPQVLDDSAFDIATRSLFFGISPLSHHNSKAATSYSTPAGLSKQRILPSGDEGEKLMAAQIERLNCSISSSSIGSSSSNESL